MDGSYDITHGRWIDPAIPGATAALNALSDVKTTPEGRSHARDLLGWTDPLGWDATPTESRWAKRIDIAASVALIVAVAGVIGLIGYVMMLPGVVK